MKKFFLITACIIFCTVALANLLENYLQKASLKETLLEEVHNFIPLSVEENKLSEEELRVYQYVASHTLDPIAALAGTDTDVLRNAVHELEKNSESISALYTEQIASDTLFPTTLLLKLAELEDVRQKLLEEPTRELANQYHALLLEFLVLQQNKLTEVSAILGSDGAGASFWKGLVGGDTASEQMSTVAKEINILQEKEHNRYACLAGEKTCEPTLVIPQKGTRETLKKYSNQVVPEKIQFYQKFYTSFFEKTKKQEESLGAAELEDVPLILFTDSFCAIHPEVPTYAILSESRSAFGNIPRVELTLLEDIYFSKVAPGVPLFGQIPDNAPTQYILKKTHYYTCIDSGYDIQKALSIQYLRKQLLSKPLATSNSLFQEILNLQTRIIDNPSIVDSDVEHFIDLLDSFLKNRGTRFFEEEFGEEKMKRLINIIHTWKSQSAWFDYTVGATEGLMRPVLYIDPEGNAKMPFSIFFVMRSNFVSLYQLSNRTIISRPKSFLSHSNNELEGQLIFPYSYPNVLSYEEDLAEEFPTIESLLEMAVQGNKYAQQLLGI